jgi:hypothetical protein
VSDKEQIMWKRRNPVAVGVGAVIVAAVMVLAACGDADSDDDATATTVEEMGEGAQIPVVNITASGEEVDGAVVHHFSAPEGLTAGPVQVNLVNNDAEPHHAQLFKLNDGVTMDDLGAALQTGDLGAVLQIGVFTGGTATTDPMAESTVDAIVELEAGQYVILCFIEDANGVPHLATGMVEPFTVAPSEGDVAALPTPDLVLQGLDFGYDQSALPAQGYVELTNVSDTQAHEVNVFQLAEGATLEDVAAFFGGEGGEGPPPFSAKGGVQALMPGASQLMATDLDPGEYVILCGIPDPTDGVPHMAKGMVQIVTVS